MTGEVLPKIRQTGAYAPNLDDPATLRRLLLGKMDRIDVLEAQVEEKTHALAIAHEVIEQDSPKVEAYDALMDDKSTVCLADAARLIGARQELFFSWLRSSNIVFDKGGETFPDAKHRADGRFDVKITKLSRNRFASQTRVTRQGLVWLRHRWAAHLIVLAKEAAAARIQGELGV